MGVEARPSIYWSSYDLATGQFVDLYEALNGRSTAQDVDGTERDDVIIGDSTTSVEALYGYQGDDYFVSIRGNQSAGDWAYGGSGNDVFVAVSDPGAAPNYTGLVNSHFFGGTGNDSFFLNASANAFGEDGDDRFVVGAGVPFGMYGPVSLVLSVDGGQGDDVLDLSALTAVGYSAFVTKTSATDGFVEIFDFAGGGGTIGDVTYSGIETIIVDGPAPALPLPSAAKPEPDATVVTDVVRVSEASTAGDTETVGDSGSVLSLGRPIVDGQVYTIDGVSAEIGQFVDLSFGGRLKVSADGSIDFDAAGQFEALAQGELQTQTLTYDISGVSGEIILEVAGEDDLTDGDEAFDASSSDQAVAIGNLLDNATDQDAGAVLSIAQTGSGLAGTNGGLFTISADGTAQFDANGDFDDLRAGETRTTTLAYTVADGQGGADRSTVSVIVTGAETPAHLAVVLEASYDSLNPTYKPGVMDLVSDRQAGSWIDLALWEVVEIAQGMDADDTLSLILTGMSFAGLDNNTTIAPESFSVGELMAAVSADKIEMGALKGFFDSKLPSLQSPEMWDFFIDLHDGFTAAKAVFDADGLGNAERDVVVMTVADPTDGGGNLRRNPAGDSPEAAFDALNAVADVDVLLLNDRPLMNFAQTDEIRAVLGRVDSDGTADLYSAGYDPSSLLADAPSGATISGRVFSDVTGTSLEEGRLGNPAEPGIEKVYVVLLNADGSLWTDTFGKTISTFTAADGTYTLSGVQAGDWSVGFERVAGQSFVAKGVDADSDGVSDDVFASDVNDGGDALEVLTTGFGAYAPRSVSVFATSAFSVAKDASVQDVDAGLTERAVKLSRGDDTFEGTEAAEKIYGFGGNDVLSGGGGDDVLDGGPGNDVLIGGAGKDAFIFRKGDGTTKINDYELGGMDLIDLEGFESEIRTDRDLLDRAYDAGSDTVFDLGNDDFLILVGIQLNQIAEADLCMR